MKVIVMQKKSFTALIFKIMLVQTPSKIFKSDFAVWKMENFCQIREIFTENNSKLRKVTEVVLEENGKFIFQFSENSNVLILVLYGEIIINDFQKQISANEVFTLKSKQNDFLMFTNYIKNEKADILIIELESKKNHNSFYIKDLEITVKNSFQIISENLDYPNFIGLYDGRKEDQYALNQAEKSVFGMVLNGAFEFQNRLLENRDAILLSEIETLEFEALSENALLLFLEI